MRSIVKEDRNKAHSKGSNVLALVSPYCLNTQKTWAIKRGTLRIYNEQSFFVRSQFVDVALKLLWILNTVDANISDIKLVFSNVYAVRQCLSCSMSIHCQFLTVIFLLIFAQTLLSHLLCVFLRFLKSFTHFFTFRDIYPKNILSIR